MTIYSLNSRKLRDEEENFNRIAGPVSGLATDDWPRRGGRPMQHLFTLDLEGLEIDVPKVEEHRLMVVFSESLFEMSAGDEDQVEIVWVPREEFEAHPETAPPEDFVPDPVPEYRDDVFFVREVDREMTSSNSFVGGQPRWSEDGEPDEVPGGGFIMQASYTLPLSREPLVLYLFEDGVKLLPMHPDREAMPRWEDAVAESLELVVRDEVPPAGALQKWGGLARGVSEYDWPNRMSHLFTYEWTDDDHPASDVQRAPGDFSGYSVERQILERYLESSERVAIAVFTKLKKDTNWGEQPGFFKTRRITRQDVEDWDPEDVPDVEVLPEKTLELRAFPEGTPWRELRYKSFVGPRPAWRNPDGPAVGPALKNKMQLTEELLPNAPGPGTLHFKGGGGYPWWHPDDSKPQATSEVYRPKGTLGDDVTTAAIVAGWEVSFEEWSVEQETLGKLDAAVERLNEELGLELTLFVPGDTCTNPDDDASSACVIGRSAVVTEAWAEGPTPFTHEQVAEAIGGLPELDDTYWAALGERLESFEGAQAGPHAYLLSWGPLCYGAIHIGVSLSEDERDQAKHTYAANQDMFQTWSSEGLDGESLQSVEFSSVARLELGDSAHQANVEKVADLDAPTYFLLCRYD